MEMSAQVRAMLMFVPYCAWAASRAGFEVDNWPSWNWPNGTGYSLSWIYDLTQNASLKLGLKGCLGHQIHPPAEDSLQIMIAWITASEKRLWRAKVQYMYAANSEILQFRDLHKQLRFLGIKPC